MKKMTELCRLNGRVLFWLLICAVSSPTAAAAKKLNVVTSTADMAALAQEVGGDRINVESIAKGLPGPALCRSQAQLSVEAASGRLIDQRRIAAGNRVAAAADHSKRKSENPGGGTRLSGRFAVLPKSWKYSQGTVTRAEGDVHPLGNPHYWLDPDNGRRIARGIAGKLADLDPGDAAYFQQRFQDFDKRLSTAEQKWDADDEAVSRTKDSHLSSFVHKLRQAFWIGCDRICGAATGHSANAQPHDRTDPVDKAGKLQSGAGGALFRSENAAVDRARDRRSGRCVSAFRRRRETGHNLL